MDCQDDVAWMYIPDQYDKVAQPLCLGYFEELVIAVEVPLVRLLYF